MSKKLIQDIITRAVGSVQRKDATDGVTKRGRPWAPIGIIVIGVALILVIFLLFSSSFSRVSLKIVTTRKVVDIDNMVVISKDGAQSGIKYNVMRSKDTKSAKVPITGSKTVQKYASGVATIYNYGRTAQRLVVNTRLETSDGKIYKINKAVLIPAAKQSPGAIVVTVHAALPGSQYNISPSEFTLPGLKGGPRFDLVRAKSDKEILGGFSGEVKMSSVSDIEKAKQGLRGAIIEKLTKNALLQVPKGFILYNDAMFPSFDDNVVDKSTIVDTPDGQPSLKVTGTLNSIILDKNDLQKYIISKTLPSTEKDANVVLFDLDKLTVKILNKEKIVLDGSQSIVANISGRVPVAWDFDEEKLKEKLSGLKKSKYQEVFKAFPSIERAEAVFSPSWALYFPSDLSRITINKGF